MAMTRLQGWEGYGGVGVQTAAISTSVAATKFQALFRATLKELQPEKAVLPAIQKSARFFRIVQGNINVAGDMVGPLNPDEWFMGRFWADLMGGNNTVSGSATVGFTHTFDESVAATAAHWPSYGLTVEQFLGGDDATMMSDFLGCFVNSVAINVPESGPVEVTAGLLGRSETTGDTVGTPTFSTVAPFERYHVDLKLGAAIGSVATVEYKTLTFNYNRNLALKKLGNNQYPIGVLFGVPAITCQFTFDLQKSRTVLNYFKNNTTALAAQIVFTHTALAGSSSGVHALTLNMPKITMLGEGPELSGTEALPVTMNFHALYDPTATYMFRAIAVNSESGTYAVN